MKLKKLNISNHFFYEKFYIFRSFVNFLVIIRMVTVICNNEDNKNNSNIIMIIIIK